MELLIHNNKLLKPVDSELFRGWVEVPEAEIKTLTGDPKYHWKGSKIPFALWEQVCGFLRWTQKQFKEEAMVTFFYHIERREWAAWAFPQEPNGMTIKLLPELQAYKDDRKRFGAGWIQAGSVHHHCGAGAFASGTDNEDECNRDGVHITLGKMEDAYMDLDIRQVFDGVKSKTTSIEWIECPSYLADCPKHTRWQFWDFAIRAVPLGTDFPAEWKERIYEKPTYRGAGVNGPQNPQAGTSQQPGQVSQGATLLTKGSSQTATGAGATRGSKKSHGSRGSSVHTGNIDRGISNTDWGRAKTKQLEEILGRLSLGPVEAYGLIAGAVDHSWKAEEVATREALRSEILKTGMPMLYAEGLLEAMVR